LSRKEPEARGSIAAEKPKKSEVLRKLTNSGERTEDSHRAHQAVAPWTLIIRRRVSNGSRLVRHMSAPVLSALHDIWVMTSN
jgi:hypothetical protein